MAKKATAQKKPSGQPSGVPEAAATAAGDTIPRVGSAAATVQFLSSARVNRISRSIGAGRLNEALAESDRAVKAEPDDSSVYAVRGLLLLELDRFDDALRDYDRSIELDPDESTNYVIRAEALYFLGRVSEAKADLQRSVELKNDYINDEQFVKLRRFLLHQIYQTHFEPYIAGLGGGINKYYPDDVMDRAARDLNAEATKLGYTFESALETLRQQASAVGRATTSRAEAKPRPKAAAPAAPEPAALPAEGLSWPVAKWKSAREKILGKKHGIVTFLVREWQPFIEKTGAVVTVAMLKKIDEDAGESFGQYLKTHDMPANLSIVKTRELSLAGEAASRPVIFRQHGMRKPAV